MKGKPVITERNILQRPERQEGETAEAWSKRLKAHGYEVKDLSNVAPRARLSAQIADLSARVSDLAAEIAEIPRLLRVPAPSTQIEWQGQSFEIHFEDHARLAIAHQISDGLGRVDVRLVNDELLPDLAIGDIENILQQVLRA